MKCGGIQLWKLEWRDTLHRREFGARPLLRRPIYVRQTPGVRIQMFMARQKGFEPLTHGLEGRCSVHLSYWRDRGEPI